MFGNPTYAVASAVDDDTVMGVSCAPPAEYVPVAVISLEDEYTVVLAFRFAFAVYKAIFIVSVVRSWTP
jgi:hypothetical protein